MRDQQGRVSTPIIQPHAPFNFVRLWDRVWLPDLPAPYHDMPFEDGVCGTITVELRTATPLMVGDQRTKHPAQGQVSASAISFFKFADKPAIPGSSLRGMLRSVVEISTFGRLSMIDDRRMGIRDLSGAAADIYRRQMVEDAGVNPSTGKPIARAKPRAGWLTFDRLADGTRGWVITECDLIRIETSDVVRLLERREPGSKVDLLPPTRPDALQRRAIVTRTGPTAVRVLAPEHPRCVRSTSRVDLEMRLAATIVERSAPSVADAPGHEWLDGWLVMTGTAESRHREFIFSMPEPDALRIAVPADVWRDFALLNDDATAKNSVWSKWRALLATREVGPDAVPCADGTPPEPGIPVFWLAGDNAPASVRSFGLAHMFKVAYPLSTHGMLAAADPRHVQPAGDGRYDMAELLFGTAASETGGLKGRVACGLACAKNTSPARTPPVELLLSSPKPNYFPFYVEQHAERDGRLKGNWQSYLPAKDRNASTPRLRGPKRYPAHSQFIAPPRVPKGQASQATNLSDPVAAGETFSFTITLHNIRPVEAGALMWAIAFGADPTSEHLRQPGCRHALGMGKPYGLGGVTLRVQGAELVANKLSAERAPVILNNARAIAWLNDALAAFKQEITKAMPGWENSEPVRHLRAMATPRDPRANPPLAYMQLDPKGGRNDFVAVKNQATRRTLPDPDWPPR